MLAQKKIFRPVKPKYDPKYVFTARTKIQAVTILSADLIQISLPNAKTNRRDIMENKDFFKWEVIHTYTRKQALADGVLVDITDLANANGFKVPTAVTAGLWAIVNPTEELEALGQSLEGRLRDVLLVLFLEAKQAHRDCDRIRFKVAFQTAADRIETVDLLAVMGPDDDMKPCLTIGLPEDF